MYRLYGVHPRTIKRNALKRAVQNQLEFFNKRPNKINEEENKLPQQLSSDYHIVDTIHMNIEVDEEVYFIENDDIIDPERFLFDDGDLEEDLDLEVEDEDCLGDDSHELKLLRNLVVTRRLRRETVRELLSIFRYCGIAVPKSSYGLFKKQKTSPLAIKQIDGGEYHHHGIKNALLRKKMQNLSSLDTIKIDIGIDGIPLFRSSNTTMWPILGRITNTTYKKPFVIGAFVGHGKPGIFTLTKTCIKFNFFFNSRKCK
jgi:hypothetical protein